MAVDDGATQRALSRMMAAVQAATPQASRDMAEEVERAAATTTPIAKEIFGHFDGREDDPGELLRSFRIDGPYPSARGSKSLVGPTAIFARQRELGGPIKPRHAKVLAWLDPEGEKVTSHGVFQEGEHYLHDAVTLAEPRLNEISKEAWAQAIREATS